MPSTGTLAAYGIGGGLGLLLAGWAVQTYVWVAYQRANPDVGHVSTGAGFEVFLAALFLGGVAIAFTSFATGLSRALDDGT